MLLSLRRSGRGLPVVFLGGTPTTWDVLADVARAIAGTHEAIELSLPGYGASAPLAGRYTLEAAHAAVEQTLIEAGVRECALVGFSGGAYRALAIALRGAIRVTHLLSLAGLASLSAEEAAGFRGFAEALRAGAELKGIAAQRFLSPAFAAAHPEACVAVEGWLDAAPREVVAAELDAFAEAPDLTPALAGLRIPVAARVGTLDAAAPVQKSEAIVAACAGAALETVAGAGHALMFEDLAGTIASLRRLLAR